jgi:hypothetical protein
MLRPDRLLFVYPQRPRVYLAGKSAQVESAALPYINFYVRRDGQLLIQESDPYIENWSDWITPKSATVGDDYEFMLTTTSGTLSSSSFSAGWNGFSSVVTDYQADVQSPTSGTKACTFILAVRKKNPPQWLSHASYTLVATDT